ncbi:MAG: VOC family protein [Pseudomonadota bacterium]
MSDIDNSPSISPYITVKDAAAAIEFYCSALGAEEDFRLCDPADGRIGHAQLNFGTSTLMISDEYPDFGALGPITFGGSPVKLHLTVEDVNSVFAKALELGAVELRPVHDEFYGSRSGMLTDPFGHTWHIETQIEHVPAEEMQNRWDSAGSD